MKSNWHSVYKIGAGTALGAAVIFTAMLLMRSPGEAEGAARTPSTTAAASAAGATVSSTEPKLKVEPTGYR